MIEDSTTTSETFFDWFGVTANETGNFILNKNSGEKSTDTHTEED